MHTVKPLKYMGQFRKDLEREFLICLPALQQDPINFNSSLIIICLACFPKPCWVAWENLGDQYFTILTVRRFPWCLTSAASDSFSYPASDLADTWQYDQLSPEHLRCFHLLSFARSFIAVDRGCSLLPLVSSLKMHIKRLQFHTLPP